jgi:glucokinase
MTAYVLSGDCGVTNTRLSLWSIPAGCVLGQGKPAPGELVLAKKYVKREILRINQGKSWHL